MSKCGLIEESSHSGHGINFHGRGNLRNIHDYVLQRKRSRLGQKPI